MLIQCGNITTFTSSVLITSSHNVWRWRWWLHLDGEHWLTVASYASPLHSTSILRLSLWRLKHVKGRCTTGRDVNRCAVLVCLFVFFTGLNSLKLPWFCTGCLLNYSEGWDRRFRLCTLGGLCFCWRERKIGIRSKSLITNCEPLSKVDSNINSCCRCDLSWIFVWYKFQQLIFNCSNFNF